MSAMDVVMMVKMRNGKNSMYFTLSADVYAIVEKKREPSRIVAATRRSV